MLKVFDEREIEVSDIYMHMYNVYNNNKYKDFRCEIPVLMATKMHQYFNFIPLFLHNTSICMCNKKN